MGKPTSFRLSAELLAQVDEHARAEGRSVSSIVSSMLDEAVKTRRFPGVIYRPGPTGRRAAIAGGPDVWEIVRAIKQARGRQELRIARVADEAGLPRSMVRLAVDFYASFPEEIDERIAADEREAERVEAMVKRREQLFR